jgi:hypothetical protein
MTCKRCQYPSQLVPPTGGLVGASDLFNRLHSSSNGARTHLQPRAGGLKAGLGGGAGRAAGDNIAARDLSKGSAPPKNERAASTVLGKQSIKSPVCQPKSTTDLGQ